MLQKLLRKPLEKSHLYQSILSFTCCPPYQKGLAKKLLEEVFWKSCFFYVVWLLFHCGVRVFERLLSKVCSLRKRQ